MKLFTKEIEKKLQDQYPKGGDLEVQNVICKIFNPYGSGTWYIMNQDPENPDYLWCIADLFETEAGSVSKSELENFNFRGLPLERDKFFETRNAKEVFDDLLKGKHL